MLSNMAKKSFHISIKCDEAIYQAVKREAEDKGRDLSPQGLHLLRMGLLLLDFCDGHDGLEHVKRVLEETRKGRRSDRGSAPKTAIPERNRPGRVLGGHS